MRKLVVLLALALLGGVPSGAQNLFTNPDLDENLDGWIVACGTNPVWQSPDEAGCPGSGSVQVTSAPCMGLQGAGAGQCLPVGSATLISATGRVRASSGFAGVAMQFYSMADCTGTELLSVNSPPEPATGDWQTVTLDQPVAGGSVSVAVGFGALDLLSPVDAEVDSGYAGLDSLIHRDGFEGDTQGETMPCRWSSTVP